MKRDECITFVFRWEIVALVEGYLQWGGVSLQKNIGHRNLILKVWSSTVMSRILISTDVEPWPSIKCPLLHLSGIFEWYIVADLIAFVHRAPEIASSRLDRQAGAISHPGRINLFIFASGRK